MCCLCAWTSVRICAHVFDACPVCCVKISPSAGRRVRRFTPVYLFVCMPCMSRSRLSGPDVNLRHLLFHFLSLQHHLTTRQGDTACLLSPPTVQANRRAPRMLSLVGSGSTSPALVRCRRNYSFSVFCFSCLCVGLKRESGWVLLGIDNHILRAHPPLEL